MVENVHHDLATWRDTFSILFGTVDKLWPDEHDDALNGLNTNSATELYIMYYTMHIP